MMEKKSSNSLMTRVDDALSSMLSRGLSLDKQLLSSSKKILLQKIEFQPAQRTSSLFPLLKLRAKYTPLNASTADDQQTAGDLHTVPTPPGKSWIFFLKIPGPGKSWKINQKSWKLKLRSWKVQEKYP